VKIDASLDELQFLLGLIARGDEMTQAVQDLTREVSETRTVVDSAVKLIQGLKQRLDDAIGDDAALQKLSQDLDQQQQALAAAVAAGTPADPQTPPDANTIP
jgi:peptidoglycan hydrolase CwlO-like protein